MKIINPKLHIMSADTFDLVTKVADNGVTKLCHSLYKGPKAVLYNEETRCVKPIKGNPSQTTYLILVPKEKQCSNEEHTYTYSRYWAKGECEQKDDIQAHDFVQIKHALQYNYIYCASLNITLFQRQIPCPREPFVLPANQSFQIEDLHYESQSLNLHSELHFVPAWMQSIIKSIPR
jgi:hypothetical protein